MYFQSAGLQFMPKNKPFILGWDRAGGTGQVGQGTDPCPGKSERFTVAGQGTNTCPVFGFYGMI